MPGNRERNKDESLRKIAAFYIMNSPSAPYKDVLHGDRPLLYPRSFAPPNSSAEFENGFISYIESEYDSLRLFLSKESKPRLPLRKSLGKMWKTSLNNTPPSSQNPSKNITCSVVITPPEIEISSVFIKHPYGEKNGKVDRRASGASECGFLGAIYDKNTFASLISMNRANSSLFIGFFRFVTIEIRMSKDSVASPAPICVPSAFPIATEKRMGMPDEGGQFYIFFHICIS